MRHSSGASSLRSTWRAPLTSRDQIVAHEEVDDQHHDRDDDRDERAPPSPNHSESSQPSAA